MGLRLYRVDYLSTGIAPTYEEWDKIQFRFRNDDGQAHITKDDWKEFLEDNQDFKAKSADLVKEIEELLEKHGELTLEAF